MSRKSDARMSSEVGETREAKISALVAVGLTNDAIQAAMEVTYPETMPKNDSRRAKDMPEFDGKKRQLMLEAIRSVRGLMQKEDTEINELQAILGPGEVTSVDAIELKNMRRFSCGQPALDYIYGTSLFVWLKDHPKDKYKKGQYMPAWIPESVSERGWVDNEKLANDKPWFITPVNKEDYKEIYQQHGLPEAFLSIHAGSPGVGKTRLAIATTKSLNAVERNLAKTLGVKPRPVLYYNGEAQESQFRQWAGADIDKELFLVASAEQIRLERIVTDCYKYRPRVVIVDSLQMLAEVDKGTRGMKTALSRFKLLKNDVAAGLPHFIFISQLNKREELMGSRFLEHMVDMVAKVMKMEGRKGCFIFECPRKNRGGETPRGAIFQHTASTVQCLSTDYRGGPVFNLIQTSVAPVAATPAVAAGVQLPPELADRGRRRRGRRRGNIERPAGPQVANIAGPRLDDEHRIINGGWDGRGPGGPNAVVPPLPPAPPL
jgi:hypothetical protein